jgi:fructose-1,6-bisphosphatase/inositol monophosphatase family enzyme
MSERTDVIAEAATKAGEEILKYDPNSVATEIKSTAGDLVTAADLGSEEVITGIIKANFPDDIVISEETSQGNEAVVGNHMLVDKFIELTNS